MPPLRPTQNIALNVIRSSVPETAAQLFLLKQRSDTTKAEEEIASRC